MKFIIISFFYSWHWKRNKISENTLEPPCIWSLEWSPPVCWTFRMKWLGFAIKIESDHKWTRIMQFHRFQMFHHFFFIFFKSFCISHSHVNIKSLDCVLLLRIFLLCLRERLYRVWLFRFALHELTLKSNFSVLLCKC